MLSMFLFFLRWFSTNLTENVEVRLCLEFRREIYKGLLVPTLVQEKCCKDFLSFQITVKLQTLFLL